MIGPLWQARIAQLLAHKADLQGSSIHRVICAEGSYQTLTRYLHGVRGPTRGAVAVTMPIETARRGVPVRLVRLQSLRPPTGLGPRASLLGCLLCWIRITCWWFAPSIDQHHTLHGLVRFFEHIGGVPGVGRVDRMGQLGQSRSKGFVFYPITRLVTMVSDACGRLRTWL